LIARAWWMLLGGFQIVWTIIRASRTSQPTFKIAFLVIALGMIFIPFFPEVWAGGFGLDYKFVFKIYLTAAPVICLLVHLLELFFVKEEKEEIPEMEESDQGGFMFIDDED